MRLQQPRGRSAECSPATPPSAHSVLLSASSSPASYRSVARERGVAEVAPKPSSSPRTAVEPIPERPPFEATACRTHERSDLMRSSLARRSARRPPAQAPGPLRQLVFSDDGSGFNEKPEDRRSDAAHGATVARPDATNSDANDTGPAGPETVEVYIPLVAGAQSSPSRGSRDLPSVRPGSARM